MEVVTQDSFNEWKFHPVTRKLMKMLMDDREVMKEGLINDSYSNEDEVKGRCRAIAIILNLEYEDLYEPVQKKEVVNDE